MSLFIKRLLLFILPLSLLFLGLLLPPTPRASKSLLFACNKKDSLLINTQHPRIIFVGGSNISFGLNSHAIQDSLSLNPVNTGVHAGLGFKYMLENTLQFIQKGDVVVLIPEYVHFYRSYNYVSDELLRVVSDVNPQKYHLLSFVQKIKLLGLVPKFTLTKLKPTEYVGFEESDVYSVNSFNEYGDVSAHWNLASRGYKPITIKGKFNQDVIRRIKEFERAIQDKGGKLYITYPSLDELSYHNSKEKVLRVETELQKKDFLLLGNAGKYIMPKEMMFNTHYHLNKKGVDYRTQLFLEDIKEVLK